MSIERKQAEFHGLRGSPEYVAWNNMLQRCTNPNHPQYSDYGGRGIKVTSSWIDSFTTFYAEMGPRPSPRHSLDRENNELGYNKNNCRWATPEEQASNKRSTIHIDYRGTATPLAEVSRITGIAYNILHARLVARWTASEIVGDSPRGTLIHFNGEARTLLDWSRVLNMRYKTLHDRLYTSGWTVERTLGTPIRHRSK
jgi:hypothetical protein